MHGGMCALAARMCILYTSHWLVRRSLFYWVDSMCRQHTHPYDQNTIHPNKLKTFITEFGAGGWLLRSSVYSVRIYTHISSVDGTYDNVAHEPRDGADVKNSYYYYHVCAGVLESFMCVCVVWIFSWKVCLRENRLSTEREGESTGIFYIKFASQIRQSGIRSLYRPLLCGSSPVASCSATQGKHRTRWNVHQNAHHCNWLALAIRLTDLLAHDVVIIWEWLYAAHLHFRSRYSMPWPNDERRNCEWNGRWTMANRTLETTDFHIVYALRERHMHMARQRLKKKIKKKPVHTPHTTRVDSTNKIRHQQFKIFILIIMVVLKAQGAASGNHTILRSLDYARSCAHRLTTWTML